MLSHRYAELECVGLANCSPGGGSSEVVLFATPEGQQLLLEIFRTGELADPPRLSVSASLIQSGLVARVKSGKRNTLVLDNRHPLIDEVRNLLMFLNGGPGQAPKHLAPPLAQAAIDTVRPLAHRSAIAFNILLVLARTGDPVSLATIGRFIPQCFPMTIKTAIAELHTYRLIRCDHGTVALDDLVPQIYRDLILKLGELLASRDSRLGVNAVQVRERVSAFQKNSDGAPLLFGSDVRFRNLIALAKYGPMYLAELRTLSGVESVRGEDHNHAPFGRGNLTVSWQDEHGIAVALHPKYPALIPLRSLLRVLEANYPLPKLIRKFEVPSPPAVAAWDGDRLAVFGGPIPTSILASIGVIGWTFESLCVSTAIGYDRVAVKKCLKKLEEQGILEGDRQRRPGGDVRLIKVASAFPAKRELEALLQALSHGWPEIESRVQVALAQLSPRTKEHLRRRSVSLIPMSKSAAVKKQRKNSRDNSKPECLRRYFELTSSHGRELTSNDLMKIDSSLYMAIRTAWGTFGEFRKEAGLEETQTSKLRKAGAPLREHCISEYTKIAAELGYYPNSAALNKIFPTLTQRILIHWGGMEAFYNDLNIFPARWKRSIKSDPNELKESCIHEYQSLVESLGYAPSSWELRLHTHGLFKRIRKVWPDFATFCADAGILRPLRHNRT